MTIANRRSASPLTGRAFTLVEILIVVVILGILAAIVTPQFGRAGREASETQTFRQLQQIRYHIQLYRSRHLGAFPTVTEGDGTWGELVSDEHFQSAPVNLLVGPANGRRIVIRENAEPDTVFTDQYGWIYDPVTGMVWAAGLDAGNRPLPPAGQGGQSGQVQGQGGAQSGSQG
jgi:prepilin-type N-terminal cleavage/methylation domain-containing protein